MKTVQAIRGPSYRMSRNPRVIAKNIMALVEKAGQEKDELNPINLYNINWYNDRGQVRAIKLPKELTGVAANIIVLIGSGFPSGSHKVGPAYFTLIESEISGRLKKGMTIVGPSTGNFGVGTAYVGNLKGYKSVVVMPDRMSRERYDRIKKYGGDLDLTPGSESDVYRVLDRVQNYYLKKREKFMVLAQFELMPNYRFHRFVTGYAAIEAGKLFGKGKVSAFVCAPGSAGTIAAGDEIKSKYKDTLIVAAEPVQCSTLYNIGIGSHKIEGIGDQMVTLIHNVGNTDYIVAVNDQDCVDGLNAIEKSREKFMGRLKGLFGISSVCNILASIKIAKKMKFGPKDNIVTIATDGIDRYYSVLKLLKKKNSRSVDSNFERYFRKQNSEWILEVDKYHLERLYNQKYRDWTPRGYQKEYLDEMKSQEFWDREYEKIPSIDKKIENLKEPFV